jgi:hypothetical protein
MTFESIGRFFGVRSAIIQAQIELAKSPVGAPGRPGWRSAATKEWLENLTRIRFEERKPITYAEVLDSLQYDRPVVLKADMLHYAILFGILNRLRRLLVSQWKPSGWR